MCMASSQIWLNYSSMEVTQEMPIIYFWEITSIEENNLLSVFVYYSLIK